MLDSGTAVEPNSSEALPHAAERCLRNCSCVDHANAEQLRARSQGEHSRNQKRRTRRLKVSSKLTECRARELAQEGR